MDQQSKVNIVFILEDYDIISNQLVESLKNSKELSIYDLEYCECNNISDANGRYRKLKDRILCMICDSNMSAIGLPKELKSESNNGLFSGWLWLCDKIEKGDTSLLHKSIIYTAYSDLINEKIRENKSQMKIKNDVIFVNKKSVASRSDNEIELIREIIKKLKKK
jgi:hypothetical protein